MQNPLFNQFFAFFEQLLPCLLNNHGSTGIRKQKFIGTRKHDLEASKTSHEHMSKNPVGSMSMKNIQGTSTQMKSDDEESIDCDSTNKKTTWLPEQRR